MKTTLPSFTRQWALATLLGAGVSSCYTPPKTPDERAAAQDRAMAVPGRIVPWEELTPRERTTMLVLQDLSRAQDIEAGKSRTRPADSIIYDYEGRTFRFANVHALRATIKRRLDSLRATGPLPYDTIPTGPTVTGTLHTLPHTPADVH